MMKQKKAIGMDAYYRVVFVGDEVVAEGVSYTILENGWAKPVAGGSEVAFQRLKAPEVTARAPLTVPGDHTQARKFVEGPDGKVRPAQRATPVPDVHMHDGIIEVNLDRADMKEPVQATPRTSPDPDPAAPTRGIRAGIGGKKNKSGWSKLYAITKTLGISGVGLTGYLRDHGFDVSNVKGSSCVKVEDREKVVDFLRQNTPPPGLAKTSSFDGAIRRVRQEVSGPPFKTTAPPPAQAPARSGVSVREATDKMLVDELRGRGWVVVCTKTQRL